MTVGFELARLEGSAPRGGAAEEPSGGTCAGCAALREELSRLRREGIEARWAANYWRSMHGRARARERLARAALERSRSASTARELERTASGLRHACAALAVVEETLEPSERSCPRCGRAYVANGATTTELIEVEVRAHVRRGARRWPRRRRGCSRTRRAG